MGSSNRIERAPIEERRAERELFFWTAAQVLALVLLTALTICLVVLVVEGRIHWLETGAAAVPLAIALRKGIESTRAPR